MKIKSMDMAWVIVADIKKAKKFFIDTLGLEIACCTDEHNWMELRGHDGGMALGVGECGPEDALVKPGQNAVVTMTVDDIEAARAELTQKGVVFKSEVIEIPGHVKMIFFVDPDNNLYQLTQDLSPK